KKWLDAMNVEMQSMKDNDVWVLVELPHNARTVRSKWLFKKKTDMDDAEYIAAFNGSKEAVWIYKFISGLGIVPTIEEPIIHYLRETIKLGDVKIEKIHTDDNLADPFTKALAFPKHSELTRNIGLLPASSFIAPNPAKVKIETRPRAAHEVSLLTTTANRVIDIEDMTGASGSSGTPSSRKVVFTEDPDSEKSASFTFMVVSPGSIYQPGWGVTNNCRLDTPAARQDIVDHIVPPGYFSELRHLPNDKFLN
nr:hypothetical protein [Tanacetum cinerariifolium]